MPYKLNLCRDQWAKTKSFNKGIKVYLGAPAAIGTDGHLSSKALITLARATQKNYTSFGGVMLWDADSAYCKIILLYHVSELTRRYLANQKYHVAVKNAIRKPVWAT